MTRLIVLTAALLLATPLFAHEVTVGDLRIVHPHIPQPAASARAAGGYMEIVNSGTEADRLIAVETGIAARAEVHESRVDASGVGTMVHLDALEIPAGQTVALEPGGYHVMFMGLKIPLTEGTMHKATLIFERTGPVEVEFSIDPPAGQGMTDHSAHGG